MLLVLCIIVIKTEIIIERWKLANFYSLSAYKHAMLGTAFEVPFSLYATIIIASRLIQPDANPGANAWDLRNVADVSYNTSSVVVVRE